MLNNFESAAYILVIIGDWNVEWSSELANPDEHEECGGEDGRRRDAPGLRR